MKYNKMVFVLLCFIVAFAPYIDCEQENYLGHKVLKVHPRNDEDLVILKNLEHDFDFWTSIKNVKQPVDVRVSPQQASKLEGLLKQRNIPYETMISNVGQLISEQMDKYKSRTPSKHFEFNVYHTLAEIQDWTSEMAVNHSDIATLITLETPSFEGRFINFLKVSTGGEKPAIWFDGGIHSREWVSPATVVYIINEFLTGYANGNEEIVALLEAFDWYMMPVFNVDGYDYTWADDGDRLWRKTRSTNEGSVCIGTDPNRNWDIEWGTVGVSDNPCTETYCGSAPFSEIEVRTVVDYLETIPNLVGYYAYHNYGQFYMAPVGFDTEPTPDFDEHMRVCEAGEALIEAVNGVEYICDSLYNTVGLSSGSSADYTYAVLNVLYSFGLELRDKGEYGFLLPEDQILPCAQENFEGLKEMARQIQAGPLKTEK